MLVNTINLTPNEPEILANDIFETVDQSQTNPIDLNEAESNIETPNSELNIESERIESKIQMLNLLKIRLF